MRTSAIITIFTLLCCSASRPEQFIKKSQEAHSFLKSGHDLVKEGDYRSALLMYDRACRSFRLIDDAAGMVGCRISLGVMQMKIGRNNEARATLLEALDLCDEYGEETLKGEVHINLALWHIRASDHARAFESLRSALSVLPEGDMRRRAFAYQGWLFLEEGDSEKARKSLKAARGGEDFALRAYVAVNTARLRMHEGDLDEALEFALHAASIDRDAVNSAYLAYDYVVLSEIHDLRGDSALAAVYRNRALNIHIALDDLDKTRTDISALIELNARIPDPDEVRRLKRMLEKLEQ